MTTLVVGLDGASFELLDPWMEEGSLPTLAALKESGAAVPMRSCLPPVTCPNWQAYATGTNPGKLGVFWWERVDRSDRRIRNTSRSTDFTGIHFWERLDGQKAIVNLPTSYPPQELDGVVISGGPGAEQTGYTVPETLEQELVDRFDYRIHPEKISQLSREDPRSECTDEILALVGQRFDVTEWLLDSGEYDFVHVTVFYINVLQHFFWDHDIVREAWKRIDERLGDLLERDDVEHLFLMSDHGSNEIDRTFHVNAWLEREGYLVTESGVSDYFHRLGLTRERVRSVLGELGVEWWARNLVPRRLQMLLPGRDGTVDMSGKESVIDWETSTAVASGQGPVYVLAEGDEREAVREELLEKLGGLCDTEGRLVVDKAHRASEVYEGPFVDEGPDLLLEQAPGVHIDGKIGGDAVFDRPARWQGENKRTGLFIAHGPWIDPDASIPQLQITDIAPTILHLLNQPVPGKMDGQVRSDLFQVGTPVADRQVRWTDWEQPDNREFEDFAGHVRDRLSDLGYLER